jgi:hypothetical protein
MLDALFWIAVGAFIGWNMPQPAWAKFVTDKIVGFVKGIPADKE